MKLINAILNLLCEAFFEGTAPQADILEHAQGATP